MAASDGFKTACPSCDMEFPILDPSLIGTKIDCPRCKYRFVVEAPEPPKPKTPAPPKAGAKPAAGSPPAAKAKVGPKLPPRDQDDYRKPKVKKKAKKSDSNTVVIWGSVLVVVILGLFGVYFGLKYLPGPEQPRPRTPVVQAITPATGGTGPAAVVGPNIGDISNLLPGNAEAMAQVVVKDWLTSPLGRAGVETRGAFRLDAFEQRFGFKASAVERLVVAANSAEGWLFAVLRAVEPFDQEKVRKRLGLQPAPEGPIQGQAYFLADVGDWLRNVSQWLGVAAGGSEPRPLAVRWHDPQTLLLADVAPMKAFLQAGSKPALQTPPPGQAGGTATGPVSERFLTVKPALKRILDRLMAQETAAIAVAVDLSVPAWQQALQPVLTPLEAPVREVEAFGASFTRQGETGVFRLGLECQVADTAQSLDRRLRQKLLGREWLPLLPFLQPQDSANAPLPSISVSQQFQTSLVVSLSFPGSAEAANWLRRTAQPTMVYLRGLLDMASGRPRVFELAQGLKASVEQSKGFPPGTLERRRDDSRLGRPFPPNERVSWMVTLLPYLGPEQAFVYNGINTTVSWRDPDNLALGASLVPMFLDPRSPRSTWWVTLPSLPGRRLAATHFVGIAGVGLDAADPDFRNDPANKDKLGVFSYDQATPITAVPEGRRSTTIVVAQVPPTFKRPWIAGGGATVMGVPETRSVQPFLVPQPDGKKGTLALMADGSVRFIPADIPDEVFKAMCTLQGADPAQVDPIAPIQTPPAGRGPAVAGR
ncbi:MAG: hypothetical protein RMJ52_00825 [Gemmataceae bacterium]|nr:hypothetical protein [Gemmataceae bacterium]